MSMYNIQSALLSTFRGLWPVKRDWPRFVAGYWLGIRVDEQTEGRAFLQEWEGLRLTLIELTGFLVI